MSSARHSRVSLRAKGTRASGADVRVIVRDVPKIDMGVANGVSAKAAGR